MREKRKTGLTAIKGINGVKCSWKEDAGDVLWIEKKAGGQGIEKIISR